MSETVKLLVWSKSRQLLSDDPNEKMQWEYELTCALQSNDVPGRLADLARVPKIERAQEHFRIIIINLLLDTWNDNEHHEASLRLTSEGSALSRAASALRSAEQALADLEKHDREALWWPIAEVESGIKRFFAMVVGGSEPPESPRPRLH